MIRRWRYFPYVLVVCIAAAVAAFNLVPQTATSGRLLCAIPILLLTIYVSWMTVTPCPRCGKRLQAGGGVIWNVYIRGPAECVNCKIDIDESAHAERNSNWRTYSGDRINNK